MEFVFQNAPNLLSLRRAGQAERIKRNKSHILNGGSRTLFIGEEALEKPRNGVSYLLKTQEAGMSQERLPVRTEVVN